ncbi:hypothetical protein ACUTAH_02870 [Metapseudomonas furukawaii]|uniref:hypothetical protein n=1 Tax=Metapseudomonas furukawaii TaxID=1149133 RepID=UPI00404629A8
MANPNLLPAVLHRMHMNQLMLGSAIEELAIWIEQRGSTETADQVHQHLATLQTNADFISEGIVELMTDP